MNAPEAIEELREAGDLTEKQAEAYVLREFEGLPRESAADWMGVSLSTHDTHYGVAKKKVKAVRDTADLLDRLHGYGRDALGGGEECDECGAALQSFVPVDGGRLCPSCAGVE